MFIVEQKYNYGNGKEGFFWNNLWTNKVNGADYEKKFKFRKCAENAIFKDIERSKNYKYPLKIKFISDYRIVESNDINDLINSYIKRYNKIKDCIEFEQWLAILNEKNADLILNHFIKQI